MHLRLLPRLPVVVRTMGLSALVLSCGLLLHAQGPGGGGGAGGGGVNIGGGGGVIITPPNGGTFFPGGNFGGNTTTVDARIVAVPGFVAGSTSNATVVLTGQTPPVAAADGTTAAAIPATYWWTITGGKITSANTGPSVEFTADAPGTVSLNVTVATDGTSYTATSTLTAVAPTAAGAMTIPTTAAAAANLSATVPPANNNDRTFRWTVTGDATIASGQNTNAVTLRAGSPGLKEVSCAVALQNLATITLRSYLMVTGNGSPVTLTVNGGSGGGTFPAGSVIDVFADPPPSGKVFDRWTGDTASLGSDPLAVRSAHATAILAATPVTIAATYRDAPVWTPITVGDFNPQRQIDANNRTSTVTTTLVYFIPPGARGVVFLLHKAGGQATDWFRSPESLLLIRDLVAAGYGVAALNSVNRTAGTWAAQTTLATNLDALNHAAALDRFARNGELAAGKPVFLLGVGAGGDTAAQIADLLATNNPARTVKGVVLYGAAGTETLALTSSVPQLFVVAPNDTELGVAGAATARRDSQLLAGRGIASSVLTTAVTPVQSGSFRSLAATTPDFSATDAASVWTALKAAGMFDANSYLKSLPSADALKAALPLAYQTRIADIADRLAIANASQPLASETSSRILAFLDARVAAVSAPQPARLINLSTRGKIAFVADSFTMGFSLVGSERATLLIRAVGPALTRFGVSNALPAPRLEVNRGAALLVANEGWDQAGNNPGQVAAAATAVAAFPLAAGSSDAAVLLTLEPGNYTATIKGVNGTLGEVIAEIYDVSKNSTRLHSLSALARINSEGDLVIPGFGLQGAVPCTLLIRVAGPGLADVGVPAATLLGDPRLTVLGANGAVVGTNNNWNQGNSTALSAVFTSTGAFPFKAANGDAALVNVFNAGAYTVQAGATPAGPQVSSTASPTGAVLVEIYEVP